MKEGLQYMGPYTLDIPFYCRLVGINFPVNTIKNGFAG